MKNIHILPTDKPSRIAYYGKELKYSKTKPVQLFTTTLDWKLQNIYITSDEEIKEGDWVLNTNTNLIAKYTGHGSMDWWVKIILTTDQDLIKEGVQEIDDEFLEWFVKNPTCESVKVIKNPFYEESNYQHYKIIIPKEETKREFVNNTSKWNVEDFEKEIFEMEQELGVPSHLRWYNTKPKQAEISPTIEDLRINQLVYHKDIYWGREQMKIVGLRENEVELEGDYSGGTHNSIGRQWFPLEGVLLND